MTTLIYSRSFDVSPLDNKSFSSSSKSFVTDFQECILFAISKYLSRNSRIWPFRNSKDHNGSVNLQFQNLVTFKLSSKKLFCNLRSWLRRRFQIATIYIIFFEIVLQFFDNLYENIY